MLKQRLTGTMLGLWRFAIALFIVSACDALTWDGRRMGPGGISLDGWSV